MSNPTVSRYIVFIMAAFLAVSCHRGDRINLDAIDLDIKVHRFDKDLFSTNVESGIEELNSKYGEFFRLFSEEIIGIGNPTDPNFSNYLSSFVTDNMVSETYNEVQRVFSSTNELDKELTDAFKRYRYYFPSKQVPQVFGFVSGFNNSVVIADSILAVGFDRYLGVDCKYYPRLGIPRYLQRNMHPQKISSDLIRSWAFSEFVFNDSIDNLLSNMIYEGTLVYLTKRMLPQQPDSLVFGFTNNQVKWCKSNEKHMWAHLVEHKLLFSTDHFTINQFVSGAPFTKGFPEESPGKAAVWLGYRIVKRFMDKNKEYTLEMLMNEKDYQSILSRARYNP